MGLGALVLGAHVTALAVVGSLVFMRRDLT
jgi:hypothetical protein